MQVEPQPQRNNEDRTEHGPGPGIGPTITRPGSGSEWSGRGRTVGGIIVGALLLALAITGISELLPSRPEVKNNVQYQYQNQEIYAIERQESTQPQRQEVLQLYADRATQTGIYDWAAEDGDVVMVNGVRIELRKQPVPLPVQWPDAITIVGVNAGKDGQVITVAIRDELGNEAQYSISPGQTVTVKTVPINGK